jgi:hypothetical protein
VDPVARLQEDTVLGIADRSLHVAISRREFPQGDLSVRGFELGMTRSDRRKRPADQVFKRSTEVCPDWPPRIEAAME